jgi:hypothetical protein
VRLSLVLGFLTATTSTTAGSFEVVCLAGQRPTHEGNVSIKDGDKWKKIGQCAAWVSGDGSVVSGVLTVDDVKTNFRAWKVR